MSPPISIFSLPPANIVTITMGTSPSSVTVYHEGATGDLTVVALKLNAKGDATSSLQHNPRNGQHFQVRGEEIRLQNNRTQGRLDVTVHFLG